ncbi:MAG: GntR family transcriptional regulator [Acidimicrobiia bacterium]
MNGSGKRPPDVNAGPGAPTSKADHAYAVIRQRVLDGATAPGDRLVIEQIAREINVSAVPVREAIRRLEAEGYVTYTRNIGPTVTSIDLDLFPETVEAVAVLEAAAIGLAAPHVTASDIERARALNDTLRTSLDDLDPIRFTHTNQLFHEVLYQRCPNRRILDMVTREWALLATTRRSAFSVIPERAASSVDEHEQLLRLIESGRPGVEIEAFARGHRMRTARALLQRIGDELADDSPVSGSAR